MDMELLTFIGKEVPNAASDIKESLDLLSSSIHMCLEQLGEQILKAHNNADFERSIEISQQSKKIKEIDTQIQMMVTQLDEVLDHCENIEMMESDAEVEKIEREVPNYRDYYVDQNIEYSLYDDFTHKRPAAFKLNNEKELAKDWKEVLLKTLAVVAKKDIKTLDMFTTLPEMQGKKVPYFSKHQNSKMRKPMKIEGTDIYVETNLSANGIRNLLIKVLKQYKVSMNSYKIYLRADYSELH